MQADPTGGQMNEWPENWVRGGQQGGGAPNAADPTVNIPAAGPQGGSGGPGGGKVGSWPEQPPIKTPGKPRKNAGFNPVDQLRAAPSRGGQGGPDWPAGPDYGGGPGGPGSAGPGGPGGPDGPGGPGGPYGPQGPAGPGWTGTPAKIRPTGWRRWVRPARIFTVLGVIIALLLIGSVASYFYFNSKLHRANVLVDYSGRPALGAGSNWLITGSDSRQGLTRKEERRDHTGIDIGGGRSDTILVLHVPSGSGPTVLVSIPRDSWVDIPGYGFNKINAAYSFGGPKLLAKTVQDVTGLYINHYMEIGFGGFVHVVNAVGGVRLCVPHAIHDQASGVHLHKGCQNVDGGEALSFVRDRHSFAEQDLQRVQDQRIFLRALLRKMTSAGVLFNPFKSLPAASGVVDTLTVDKSTSLYQLLRAAFALRNPETTTVPISNPNYLVNGQDALLWNQQQAKELFNDLRTDAPVPRSLITGSHDAA
jgi:LCP family protein required for cell wall assembly